MAKNYKFLGVITLIILLHSPICAQVLKWDGMPSKSESSKEISSDITASSATVFPKYTKTDSPSHDEERFQTMLRQWNEQNPGRALQAHHVANLKSGNMSEKEILQELSKTEELNRLNPQYRESMRAKQRLIDSGLGHVWGLSGIPQYPKGASEPSDYTEWIYAVRAWTSSDDYIQQRKDTERTEQKAHHIDASGELVKPVFIDTGNPEYDAEVYHQKKLRYSEALDSMKGAVKE